MRRGVLLDTCVVIKFLEGHAEITREVGVLLDIGAVVLSWVTQSELLATSEQHKRDVAVAFLDAVPGARCEVSEDHWTVAAEIASKLTRERHGVPQNAKPVKLLDALQAAIASQEHYELWTADDRLGACQVGDIRYFDVPEEPSDLVACEACRTRMTAKKLNDRRAISGLPPQRR